MFLLYGVQEDPAVGGAVAGLPAAQGPLHHPSQGTGRSHPYTNISIIFLFPCVNIKINNKGHIFIHYQAV